MFDKLLKKFVFNTREPRYDTSLSGYVNLGTDAAPIAAFVRKGEAGRKTILHCHGSGGDLMSGVGRLEILRSLGVSFASVDYPGFGLSAGKPSVKGCHAAAHALYRHLVDLGTRPEDIVPLGVSLGSGVAVELAATEQVGGLILEVAFLSGRKMAEHMARTSGFGLPFAALSPLLAVWNPFNSARLIRKVDVPVLSIHGTADEIVPFEQGRALFDLAPRGERFIAVEGARHRTFIDVMGRDRYRNAIGDYLSRRTAEGRGQLFRVGGRVV